MSGLVITYCLSSRRLATRCLFQSRKLLPARKIPKESQAGSILQSQLTRQILAMKAHEVTTADPDRKPEDVTIMVAAFLTLAALSNEDTVQKDRRLAARVSAFHVDGPCLVATFFYAEMERLPRPSIRAMSSAWVVEIAGNLEGMTRVRVNLQRCRENILRY